MNAPALVGIVAVAAVIVMSSAFPGTFRRAARWMVGCGRPGAGAAEDTPTISAPSVEAQIAEWWRRSGLRFERPVGARRHADRIEWARGVQNRAFGPGDSQGER